MKSRYFEIIFDSKCAFTFAFLFAFLFVFAFTGGKCTAEVRICGRHRQNPEASE